MRYLIIVLSVLALAACSETFMLSRLDSEPAGAGTLKPRFNPPHQLTIVLGGKTYAGDVDSREMDYNIDDIRKRYGASSKHYQAVLSGLNTMHHVHHYKGVLKAQDGDTLTCDFMSSHQEQAALGTCEDGKGQTYEVHK
jgi:hypothetical protein